MAAGCCTVVKLPESAPHFSTLFEKLIAECVDTDFVRVVQGAVPETTKASLANGLWRTETITLFPAARAAMGS
jgi:acyl-CoA reductase-like NAD-dependent aldehyde dehydrogenase